MKGSEADPDEAEDRPREDGVGAVGEGVGDRRYDIINPHDLRKGVLEDVIGEAQSLGAVS